MRYDLYFYYFCDQLYVKYAQNTALHFYTFLRISTYFNIHCIHLLYCVTIFTNILHKNTMSKVNTSPERKDIQ